MTVCCIHLLHTELQLLGYEITPNEQAQRRFGATTFEAAIDFQEAQGLDVYGSG